MDSTTGGADGREGGPMHGAGWRTDVRAHRHRDRPPRAHAHDGVAGLLVPPRYAWLALVLREEGGGLLLTPASVHPRGPGPVAVDWDEIADVSAGWLTLPPRQDTLPSWWPDRRVDNYLRLGLTTDGEARHLMTPEVAHTGAFFLSVDDYAVDPYRLRALLEHYLTEPGDRHELGTPAALTRWRALPSRPRYRR